MAIQGSAEVKGSDGVGVEPPRVLGIREQRNKAQRLGIGEGRGENPKNSHKGVGWCEFCT